MRRNTIIIVLVLAAIVAIAAWVLRAKWLPNQAAATDVGREATVQRGTLLSTVRASGSIEPEAQVSLNFGAPGTVDNVNVKVGQQVKQNDILAQLDTAELELSVAQAEKAYLIQQVTYSQTVAGPKPADLAAAQAQLSSAWAQYNDLKKGPKADQLAQAEAQLTQTRNQLKQANIAHDKTMTCVTVKVPPSGKEEEICPALGPIEEQARMQVETAQASFDAAQANYDRVASGAGSVQLAAAWAQVQQAQSSLDRLSPDPDRAKIARIQMEQAQISYEQAKQRLLDASIIAPFDGMVTQVNITRGATASAGGLQPALVLTDMSKFHITVDVDEIDVGRLKAGQPVSTTVDALPGEYITGQVDQIAPVATVEGGVVSYQVTISLDPTKLQLRPGMSSNIAIVTESLENVLLVPNWAIRIDRATGKSYVNLKEGQTIHEVEIATGARNENDSQVVSGLSEGDVVATGSVESLSTILQSQGQ